jgi:threonine/homoserine/homoserine lactone efflux protein
VTNVGAFVGLSLVVILTPGPDTALTLRNALRGRRLGVATGFGVTSGIAVWTVAAAAGVAALVAASQPLFLALRVVGGLYLVWLGAQALRAALLRRGERHDGGGAGPTRLSPAAAYRQGLFSNLGNPKIAVFFTSFLPQFARPGHASFAALLLLGFVFYAITLAWLTTYALAVARIGHVLRRPGIGRAMDAVSGTVLVAFGVRLALERR